MVERVLRAIEKYNMIEDGDRILVAVSGGPDSIFLMWVLWAIGLDTRPDTERVGKSSPYNYVGKHYNLELRVAHLNHMIRKSAWEEAEFVKEQAEKFGIPCSIEERDVRSYARGNKLPLEEGARELRYEFLERVAKEYSMNKIAMGHTLSDEVETLILRVARGTGGRGLLLIPPKRGIKRISNFKFQISNKLEVVRPLIEVRGEEIRGFLDKEGIRYCVDESNYDFSYKRNFVRHKVVPSLIELAPDFPEKVMRLRKILEEEEEVLEKMTWERLKEISLNNEIPMTNDELVLDLRGFLDSPLAIKRRMLRKITKSEFQMTNCPRFEEIENAIKYIENSKGGKEFDLRGIKVTKSGDKIKNSKSKLRITNYCVELDVPREVEVNGIRIKSKIKNQKSKMICDDERRVYLDFEKIRMPLLVRGMRRGDRIKIKSETKICEKKLKDVFTDDKVPVWERRKIPLLVDGEGILWIVGRRRAHRALIGKDTKKILEVWVEL